MSIAGVVRDIDPGDFLSLSYSLNGLTLDAYRKQILIWDETKRSYRSYCSAVIDVRIADW